MGLWGFEVMGLWGFEVPYVLRFLRFLSARSYLITLQPQNLKTS